ncbi:MAG: S9 family peptidase, partial [Caulobacteraceae bacterium]
MLPPDPPRQPKRILQLGRERVDEYAWMKDERWREVLRDPALLDPRIRGHLEAENAYADALLASTAELQAMLFGEMRGRLKEDDSSVPFADGPFEYFTAFAPGAEHPRHLRRPRGAEGPDTVLLDEAAEAAGKPYYSVGQASHSPDHRLFAWTADDKGSEYYTLHLAELVSGERLPDGPAETTGDFAFSPDSRWLYWIWRDANARPSKVFRRPARGGEDVLIHAEADEGMFLGVGTTADRGYVVVTVQNQETSEAWIIPADDAAAAPILAEPRRVGVRYE